MMTTNNQDPVLPILLNQLHYHEVLDRTQTVANIFDAHITEHPAVKQSKNLRELAETIGKDLGKLYQMAAQEESVLFADTSEMNLEGPYRVAKQDIMLTTEGSILGHCYPVDWPEFETFKEAVAFIESKNLPVGWVAILQKKGSI